MYDIIKNVIESRKYELADMLKKIDAVWLQGILSDEGRAELIALARENAQVQHSSDIMRKLEELDLRVKALEEGKTEKPTETHPEYVVGKWYYKGDKVTFDGKIYECVAPDGAVCTWNPNEYPAYWNVV